MKNFKIILVCVLAVTLWSCQRETDTTAPIRNHKNSTNPCLVVTNLMAGQHHLSGQLQIRYTADSVFVGYITTGGWVLRKTHLYIGACSGIPRNKPGNPVPGQFPYSSTFNPAVTEVWYGFAKSFLPQCGCVAAHAEVTNTITGKSETAWASGTRFTNNNWATYSSYCQQPCDRTPIDEDPRTPIDEDPRTPIEP